jgi:hypothetical protein
VALLAEQSNPGNESEINTMSVSFSSPPQALLVFAVFTAGGAIVGIVVAGWVVACAIAFLMHDGLQTLLQFPREFGVFAKSAPWFSNTDKTFWNVGASILSMVGFAVSALAGLRIARHLVVNRFHWMSDEEVDAMLKRDPGW